MTQSALLDIPAEETKAYQVLARKYRPQLFEDLKGQDVLVRVLSNALKNGRLPHAILLTGIRGVGKTTTARILAKALNCTGRDISETVDPCGTCEACRSITEDRFIDVIEMDAASRTSIDDIREVIESAKYKPVAGQYKVYIIDEVHMLSKSAFNGLLKTLEEPPAHVKFIFATTEIHKIPKTVLSRCMRFDLCRLELETLKAHFQAVAEKENFQLEDRAALLIAKAADGSARDGMSILDQALTLSEGQVTAQLVEDMLGIGEQHDILSLWKACLEGESTQVLETSQTLHAKGLEPLATLQDLLNLTHTLTTLKVNPELLTTLGLPEADLETYKSLAEQLSFPSLNRLWQLFLKGLEDVQRAPSPQQAFQMVLLRAAYASTLPSPEDVLKATLTEEPVEKKKPEIAQTPQAPVQQTPAQPTPEEKPAEVSKVTSFEDVVALAREKREALLQTYLHRDVRLVSFEPGNITINITPAVPKDFSRRLARKLEEWTQQPWEIKESKEQGQESLECQENQRKESLIAKLSEDVRVKETMETFPGAKVTDLQEGKA